MDMRRRIASGVGKGKEEVPVDEREGVPLRSGRLRSWEWHGSLQVGTVAPVGGSRSPLWDSPGPRPAGGGPRHPSRGHHPDDDQFCNLLTDGAGWEKSRSVLLCKAAYLNSLTHFYMKLNINQVEAVYKVCVNR